MENDGWSVLAVSDLIKELADMLDFMALLIVA
jgi:hypothetical protein